jgi:hypothetical protein
MVDDFRLPQSCAILDCGQTRSELDFQMVDGPDGLVARATDDLFDYAAAPVDLPLHGTLFVRNKQTGALKAIPVGQVIQVSRQCKRQAFQPVENAGTADLIAQFGSRTAKRIYNTRQHK